MISELAVSEIESLKSRGLNPTVRDIIRLNGLGLKIERTPTCGDLYALPRVSYLGDLVFREPSVSALEWIDRVEQFCSDDEHTRTVTIAFALSRHPSELPDYNDRRRCQKELKDFYRKDIGGFTFEQLNAAVLYAVYGSDVAAREYPPLTKEDKDLGYGDVLRSVGAGVLMEALAVGLGMSVRDISELTAFRVRMLVELALRRANCERLKKSTDVAQAEFFAALSEITERLTKEKKGE